MCLIKDGVEQQMIIITIALNNNRSITDLFPIGIWCYMYPWYPSACTFQRSIRVHVALFLIIAR